MNQPADIVIRPARVEDIPVLLAFWAEAGENHGRPVDNAPVVEALLSRDPDALIVAELGEIIVGTVIAGWDGWRAHLYRLAVAPDHRGRGIARLLLEDAERRLRSLGAIRFDAMVLATNSAGASAWAAMDYHPQEEWVRWVKRATTEASSD
ncbi:GNAT family N-acetyltransferase [Phytoactinopolyspora mesophila]|uniref:GNAT family N-acetyltransferase n=1 Tax=Phytoactinopolyspora mesophila TaxID=2650750 RepID=A0A7K3M908_9ACTN|nr:GNAT family N-acetyltransferase [Phytoactinopolyspora mesophila]NDL59795.1 GNAT family N-acetyltransferase [Phytoactinopolyspora mesophila]